MKATHLILAAVLVMAAFFSGCGTEDIKHKCAECKNMVNVGATRCEHCGGNPYKGQHPDQALVEEAFNQALENQREGKLGSSDDSSNSDSEDTGKSGGWVWDAQTVVFCLLVCGGVIWAYRHIAEGFTPPPED